MIDDDDDVQPFEKAPQEVKLHVETLLRQGKIQWDPQAKADMEKAGLTEQEILNMLLEQFPKTN